MDIGVQAILEVAFILLGVIGVLLALVDILSRDSRRVRGSRLLWGIVVLFIPFGFVAYFLIGRRRPMA